MEKSEHSAITKSFMIVDILGLGKEKSKSDDEKSLSSCELINDKVGEHDDNRRELQGESKFVYISPVVLLINPASW